MTRKMALTLLWIALAMGCGPVRTVTIPDAIPQAVRAERLADAVEKGGCASGSGPDPDQTAFELRESARTIRSLDATVRDLTGSLEQCEQKAASFEADHNAMVRLRWTLWIGAGMILLGFAGYIAIKVLNWRPL